MQNKKYTILVLEDEIPLVGAISDKLKTQGLGVISARSVGQAEENLDSGMKIDAVWLDHYLMGKETGLNFIAKLKGDEKLKDIPVFVVSNTVTPEKLNTYLRLGAERYFVKSNHKLDEIISDIYKFIEGNDR